MLAHRMAYKHMGIPFTREGQADGQTDGQMSLDDYDSYRETLRSMGIERCIELQQTALDRYFAR